MTRHLVNVLDPPDHIEHRLKLVGGGSVAIAITEGRDVVLIVSEGGRGFSAVDLTLEEIDMLVRLLRGDADNAAVSAQRERREE